MSPELAERVTGYHVHRGALASMQRKPLPTAAELLGSARRVTVTKDDTTIVEGAGKSEDLSGRVAQIKAEIENTDSDWDR